MVVGVVAERNADHLAPRREAAGGAPPRPTLVVSLCDPGGDFSRIAGALLASGGHPKPYPSGHPERDTKEHPLAYPS